MFTGGVWDFIVWSFFFFIWMSAIMIWFRVIVDMFSDHTLSGWAKAGWSLLLIFVPWLGALIYMIARGASMNERALAAASEMRASQERYIRQVASTTPNPADQIATAKALLDSGAITQAEFGALKGKALA